MTTDSHHYYGVQQEQEQTRPVPSGGVANIILLDDRVYITPVRRTRRGNRTADLTLDPTGAIFAGPNFDEQIIFLNGPDLLETVEPVARARMGKVARNAPDEPLALPLRPIGRDPADSEQLADGSVVAVVYADQHETVRLNCEVDADITTGVWLKDGQIVHAADKKSRTADVRFVRESFGALTITDVLLEDDGVWQCEAENARGFFFNGRPIKLIVLGEFVFFQLLLLPATANERLQSFPWLVQALGTGARLIRIETRRKLVLPLPPRPEEGVERK